MRKEGLLYPTCLSVVVGWGVFFASYEYMARDAEMTIARSRDVLASMPGLSASLVKEKDDDLADVTLLEHRRGQITAALEEAELTVRLAAMASAAIAAAAGVFVFALAKPRRGKKARPGD